MNQINLVSNTHRIRGRLGSIIQVTRNIGILFAYTLGAVLKYEHIPCIFICIPLLFVVCFVFVPNTPQHYLKKENIQVRIPQKKFMMLLVAYIICFFFLMKPESKRCIKILQKLQRWKSNRSKCIWYGIWTYEIDSARTENRWRTSFQRF